MDSEWEAIKEIYRQEREEREAERDKIVSKYQNQAALEVRQGGYFRSLVEGGEITNMPLFLDALDALEMRVESLETRFNPSLKL